MSTDDPSRYAPPLELRIPLSTIVDPSDGPAVAANPFVGEPPLPSAMTTSPGIATAAVTPLAAPTLPDLTDPGQVALLVARLVGEHLTGASLVPHPNAGQTMSGIGVPGQAATPGIAPVPVAHPATPGGEALPASPTPSTSDVLGVSLAPAQLEVPTASGIPASPTLGGGVPSLASGGASTAPAFAAPPSSAERDPLASLAAPARSAERDPLASFAAPDDTRVPASVSPFSIVPDVSAIAIPHAPVSVAAPSVPHETTASTSSTSPTNVGRGALPDARRATPVVAPDVPAGYRHGGTGAGGDALYGAPPDLDAFLRVEPTTYGLPRVDLLAPLLPLEISPTGVHAEPRAWQGLPTSPTGSHEVPSTVPDATFAPQVPSSGRGPASPLGSPELPSTGVVPSSSPFGAPIDLGGMAAHPLHATSVPTFNEPSTTAAYTIASGDESRVLRELSRAAFDPYSVRKDFPILDEKIHGGKRLVWLDNAATTQKPRQVIERLAYFYEHENSNVHRAAHTLAARSTDAFERARESARRFLNAPSAKEVVWVRGATEGINLIAKTWGKKYIGKGDEIVVTHLEHHANIVPWQMLCAEVGAKLRVAPVDDRGDVILEKYEALLGPRTKLVSIPHVSNALGTITPAKQMVEIAHRYGAHVMVDGAQAVSHMKVDVQDLGCEWYVFSGHKVFAPTGIGVVWGKADVLDATPPWQGGGNMIEDVAFEHTKYQSPPWRFEAGTGSIGDAVGLGAAIEYVERIGMDVIDRYEHELLVYGTQRLATVPGLTMIGTSAHKAGVLSFILAGQRTEDVSAILDKDGIAVRSGHHCAQPILRRYNLEATVRASLAFYNVCEDIDALVEALHRLQAHRG